MSDDMFPSSSRRKNSNAALLETDTLGAVEQSSLDNLSRGGVILCRFGAPALLAFSTRWISVQQRQLQQSNIFLQVTWYCFPVGYGKPRFRDKEREGKRERERERGREIEREAAAAAAAAAAKNKKSRHLPNKSGRYLSLGEQKQQAFEK